MMRRKLISFGIRNRNESRSAMISFLMSLLYSTANQRSAILLMTNILSRPSLEKGKIIVIMARKSISLNGLDMTMTVMIRGS